MAVSRSIVSMERFSLSFPNGFKVSELADWLHENVK